MAKPDHFDVLSEILDLSKALQEDIIQQLRYYRASVYKEETYRVISAKLDHLRFVTELLGDVESDDVFNDFEAQKHHGNIQIAPGECLLTMRVYGLFRLLSQRMQVLEKQSSQLVDEPKMIDEIKKNRRKLLSVCRYDCRKKYFFETL